MLTAQDVASSVQQVLTCDNVGDREDALAIINRFWTMVPAHWDMLAAAFTSQLLVPVHISTGSRQCNLVSFEQCKIKCALAPAHLPCSAPDAAEVLSQVGCLCITDPRAACASPITADQEPITTALAAVAEADQVPLMDLVSPDRLSLATFKATQRILAGLTCTQAQRKSVWEILKQCRILTDAAGSTVVHSKSSFILPHRRWEDHLPALAEMLKPGDVLRYHQAPLQQQLLRQSPLQPMNEQKFFSLLAPALSGARSASNMPVVLQALDDMVCLTAVDPSSLLMLKLTHLFIHGQRWQINRLVDGNSNIFKLLFWRPESGESVHESTSSARVEAKIVLIAFCHKPEPKYPSLRNRDMVCIDIRWCSALESSFAGHPPVYWHKIMLQSDFEILLLCTFQSAESSASLLRSLASDSGNTLFIQTRICKIETF